MRRAHLLVLGVLAVACGVPTESGPDRPALGKAAAGPTVTGADPAAASQDTTLDVHVFGTGFDRGSKVAFTRDGLVDPKLHVNGTQYGTSGELIANVTVSADAATVSYDIMVTTSSGKKGIGTELFAVSVDYEILAAPTGSSNVYDAGPTGQISGTIATSCGPGFAPALWDLNRSLVPLPALAGTCGGVADAVNGSGVVVGSAYIGSSQTFPVRWLPSPAGYAVEQLSPLPNGRDPGPWSIDESGRIGSGNDAAVWSAGAGWQMLIKPAGATFCPATVVGNGGQAISRCQIANVTQGVFWSSVSSAPIVLPMPPGATGAYPRGVTASGTVVGFVTGNGYGAVRWIPNGGAWTVERLADLGKGSSALGVNDAGYVVGSVYAVDGFPRPAFWTPDGSVRVLFTNNRPGEAEGISEPDGGLVIAGYFQGKGTKTAVRWRP
jgi:hypothetical protein